MMKGNLIFTVSKEIARMIEETKTQTARLMGLQDLVYRFSQESISTPKRPKPPKNGTKRPKGKKKK